MVEYTAFYIVADMISMDRTLHQDTLDLSPELTDGDVDSRTYIENSFLRTFECSYTIDTDLDRRTFLSFFSSYRFLLGIHMDLEFHTLLILSAFPVWIEGKLMDDHTEIHACERLA